MTTKKNLDEICGLNGIGIIEDISEFEKMIHRFKKFRKIHNVKVKGISVYTNFNERRKILTMAFVYDEVDSRFNYNTGLIIIGPQNKIETYKNHLLEYVWNTKIKLRPSEEAGSDICALGSNIYELFLKYGEEEGLEIIRNIVGGNGNN